VRPSEGRGGLRAVPYRVLAICPPGSISIHIVTSSVNNQNNACLLCNS
jgi:hypothetical protein